ncbi:AAA domain-containing protein [Paenisporosarcina sp. TG20]|uniref:AAA domain-containing protein n=1 Tax=Paenisporosarcina sp. TG20 TaxID=1211706 RepID=UPI00178C4D35|nr:AAA domain-containing protein [Paenisporosarcina sp. TG20]
MNKAVNVNTKVNVMRCNLSVAHRLKKNKPQVTGELYGLLQSSPVFDVHMERLTDGQTNQKRVALYVEPAKETDSKAQGMQVMECEWTGNGLEVVHYYVTKKRLHLGNNRHKHMKMSFDQRGLVSSEMTLSLYGLIQSLPIASERSEYVKKRITGWEAYLRVMERNADVEKLEISVRSARLSQDFRKVTFELQKLPNGFDKFYGKSTVRLAPINQNLGKVVQVQMGKRIIDVELERDLQEKAREGKWKVPSNGKLAFDNIAELTQINRLKEGFKRLENGWAVNPNLERILFENRPPIRKAKIPIGLEFKQNLNEFQRQAVEGAIGAQDLYVIQGPPGTGKTTVISEICYQNAKMGLKTLVASQSNLAVDNALGKLLTDKEIRILRIGRSESIEEEGQRFVEEQVALYWKEQTLSSIQTHVNKFETNGPAIQAAIDKTKETLEKLLAERTALELQLTEKQEAKIELDHLELEKTTLQSHVEELSRDKDQQMDQMKTASEHLVGVQINYEKAIEQVELFSGTGKFSEIQEQIHTEIEELENRLKYIDTEFTLTDKKIERQGLIGKIKSISSKQVAMQEGVQQLETVKKLAELRELMGDESWTYLGEVLSLIRQLEKQQFDYMRLNPVFQGSPEVDATLIKAINYAEEKLNAHQYNMKMLSKKISMNPLLETSEVSDPHATKVVNAFREYAKKMHGFSEPMSHGDRQTLSSYYENMMSFKQTRDSVQRNRSVGTSSGNERLKQEILQTFEALKEAVGKAMLQRISDLSEEMIPFKTSLVTMDAEISEWEVMIKDLSKTLHSNSGFETEFELKRMLAEKQQLLLEMGTEEFYVDALVCSMNVEKEEVLKLQREINKLQESLQQLNQQMTNEDVNKDALIAKMSKLAAIVAIDVEHLLKQANTTYEDTTLQLGELKRNETFLAVSNDIRLEWKGMLEQSTAYDLEEIKKLYIQYANVIGVTCSISASKDFVKQYPDFDVVIIDEVSKATPPELLLPMLKGKKIILVGDHHQLPPLVGQDTMDEVLEDIKDTTEKAELKSILKESIFERLFKDLPDGSKATLRIQYRMHEHIMETINPFYREKNYGLACGLTNSDIERDHLLDGKLFARGQHILWYDMPNEQGFLEEREQHSRSFYNAAELKQIRELLVDLDQATAAAKREGRLEQHVKKKVGIISFYGEQVKKVNRLLSQELDLSHLHCRTGTVDKFQGMEMDVIILSFVRNHLQPDGNIGFLKDYRRLNVALSRARELLMIVGSVDMFTKKAHGESQKEMFRHVLNVVKQHEGLKQLETSVGRK